jgi:uncharacterized protein YdaU (DUF1376 family)
MGLTALWWWIDRWRKSTAYTDLTLEEQGAYRNLLDEANLRGGAIPNVERILAKACGDATRWSAVRPAVMAHFSLEADGWHNETLDAVLKESMRRAHKQQRYRAAHPRRAVVAFTGNGTGNQSGNETGNAPGNQGGNRRGSPDPDPDPDQDPDLRSGYSDRQRDLVAGKGVNPAIRTALARARS